MSAWRDVEFHMGVNPVAAGMPAALLMVAWTVGELNQIGPNMRTPPGDGFDAPAILLDAGQREALKRLIDRQDTSARRHPRHDYRVSSGVVLTLMRSDGRRLRYQVEPVDVSSTGMGVLHNGFIGPNVGCSLVLRTVDGELFEVLGDVARCECLRAPVHFIGIRFRQTIDLSMFVVSNRSKEKAAGDDSSDSRQREAVSSLAMELHCLAQTDCSEEDLRARCVQLCRLMQVPVADRGGDA